MLENRVLDLVFMVLGTIIVTKITMGKMKK